MIEIWMYYIHHVTRPTSASCAASLPFINPLPRHNGILKCPSNANFRILAEVEGHTVKFHQLFLKCYVFRHTTIFAYYIVGNYFISNAA